MAAAFSGSRTAHARAGCVSKMAEAGITTRQIDDVLILDLEGRLILGAATEALGSALQRSVIGAEGEEPALIAMRSTVTAFAQAGTGADRVSRPA